MKNARLHSHARVGRVNEHLDNFLPEDAPENVILKSSKSFQ
jgi:hypothetical protein